VLVGAVVVYVVAVTVGTTGSGAVAGSSTLSMM
jgi:hypothetical protein